MGLSGLEPPTSRLSGVRSNRLSYKPLLLNFHQDSSFARFHQVFLWKHHCFATLRKVCLFSNLRLRFRSSSLRKQCMGLSGLEPPTSRLSGVRSNRLSYKPLLLSFFGNSGIHLLSHTVSSIVPSADRVLTIVFGMRTGVSPGRIDTAKF